MIYLYIGLGGMVGSLLRYYLAIFTVGNSASNFPYGTLIANLIGSFLLGWFMQKLMNNNKFNYQLAAAISTGFIGSFTTFSTFSVETILMIESEMWFSVCIYLILSILGGLFLAAIGYGLIQPQSGDVES